MYDRGQHRVVRTHRPAVGSATDVPAALVHRSETCGCCGAYEDFLEERGFTVIQEMHDSVESIKQELGVPQIVTAIVDGQVAAECGVY